jgi:teichuronic acid biosynthesis glycosyltransferase TuaG
MVLNHNRKPHGVSVIMPAWNSEKTIDFAISSVVAQTHQRWELIVIDDGSSDATCRIVREWEARDPRVKLLKNRENQGVSLTRNRGVRHARYPFIAFLDSDDAWLPEKLELQLAELENHPEAAICCTATAFLDCRGCRLRHIFQVPDSLTYRDLLPQNAICCSSVLARAEYVRRFPMVPDPDIHEDYALWLAILGVTPRAVGVDRALTIYRVNPAGKSGNKFRSAWMQWRTYLHIGLTRRLAAFYFTQYALRGMKKYLKIYQEGRACEDTDALRPVFGG